MQAQSGAGTKEEVKLLRRTKKANRNDELRKCTLRRAQGLLEALRAAEVPESGIKDYLDLWHVRGVFADRRLTFSYDIPRPEGGARIAFATQEEVVRHFVEEYGRVLAGQGPQAALAEPLAEPLPAAADDVMAEAPPPPPSDAEAPAAAVAAAAAEAEPALPWPPALIESLTALAAVARLWSSAPPSARAVPLVLALALGQALLKRRLEQQAQQADEEAELSQVVVPARDSGSAGSGGEQQPPGAAKGRAAAAAKPSAPGAKGAKVLGKRKAAAAAPASEAEASSRGGGGRAAKRHEARAGPGAGAGAGAAAANTPASSNTNRASTRGAAAAAREAGGHSGLGAETASGRGERPSRPGSRAAAAAAVVDLTDTASKGSHASKAKRREEEAWSADMLRVNDVVLMRMGKFPGWPFKWALAQCRRRTKGCNHLEGVWLQPSTLVARDVWKAAWSPWLLNGEPWDLNDDVPLDSIVWGCHGELAGGHGTLSSAARASFAAHAKRL